MDDMSKRRQANLELLRIVAMLMIIMLHYLIKGGVVTDGAYRTPVHYLAGLIEAFCMVAPNCYALISGYFMVESDWKPGRVGSLLGQILFYSLLIPVVMLLVGACEGGFTIYDWAQYLFPIQMEHYWFATAYVLLYLMAPFLAAGVRQMEKRKLQIAIVLLLAFFSVGKTILPIRVPTDRYGYDVCWLVCLFLVAGYLRKYGIAWLENKKNALLLYIGASVVCWGVSVFSSMLAGSIDAFSYYMQMPYTYNYLFCLLASVGLFCFFKDIAPKEGKLSAAICGLAPYTFGVYLLHEHILVRYRWLTWLGVGKVKDSLLFVLHMMVCVFLVYAAGTAADFVRTQIFKRVAGLWKNRGKECN